jgi:hypothetical protein
MCLLSEWQRLPLNRKPHLRKQHRLLPHRSPRPKSLPHRARLDQNPSKNFQRSQNPQLHHNELSRRWILLNKSVVDPSNPDRLLLNRLCLLSRKLREMLVPLLGSANHSLSNTLDPVLDSTFNALGLLSIRLLSNRPDHPLDTACNPIAMHTFMPLCDALDRLLDSDSRTDNLLAPLLAYETFHHMSQPPKDCLEARLPCGLFLARNRKKVFSEVYPSRVNPDLDRVARMRQYQGSIVDLRWLGRIISAFRI